MIHPLVYASTFISLFCLFSSWGNYALVILCVEIGSIYYSLKSCCLAEKVLTSYKAVSKYNQLTTLTAKKVMSFIEQTLRNQRAHQVVIIILLYRKCQSAAL